MSWFKKRKSEPVSIASSLIKGSGGRCPLCNADLQSIVNNEAKPVYDVFRMMGPIGASVTMDTAREQIITAGLACSCGSEIKSL